MQYVLSALIALIISVGSIFAPHPVVEQPLSPQISEAIKQYVDQSLQAPQFGTTQPIAGQTYTLAGAGVSQTATSITLSSFTIPQNGYKIQDSDLSSTFYITLEPGNSSKQEIVSCTTDVQNANGSATFSGCTRGLSPVQPYTASTTLRFSHGGGTQVIFSNPPQFYNEFAQLQNTQTITGTWTYADSPLLTTDCTVASASNEICAKGYIDGVAVAGASNANDSTKGIVEMATAAEAGASTNLGSTGARLALGANIATSSPNAGCSAFCVVVATAGKIAQAFIDLTTTYTWTALHTFTGGLTSSATTTISASNVLSNALVLNGLAYQFPSTRASSTNKVLMENGSGSLTWTGVNKKQYLDTSVVDFQSTTASSTIYAITIPGGTMSTSSVIHIRSYTSIWVGQNGSIAYLEAGYGTGTTTLAITNGTGGTIQASGGGYIDLILSGAGTTGTQKLTVDTKNMTTSLNTYAAWNGTASASLTQDSTIDKKLMLVWRITQNSTADRLGIVQSVGTLIQ